MDSPALGNRGQIDIEQSASSQARESPAGDELIYKGNRRFMAWEFAAIWMDEPDQAWKWIWRRVADDSGAVLEQSSDFPHLHDCIADAKRNGFDDSGCDTV